MDDMSEIINVNINLSIINRELSKYFNEKLGELNITRSEIPIVLTVLEEGEVTQEFIARRNKLNEATVTRALSRLEKKNFVERVRNPDDRRKRMVILTDEGKTLCKELALKRSKLQDELFKDFTNEELVEFNRLFKQLLCSLKELI